MLPAGTPPNAIIFATEKLTIREMVWVGFIINLVSTLLIVMLVYYLVPVVFSIDLNVVPDSFRL
jgi:sodium-dependent dicarboxylate transporter 2/3/5